MLAVFYVLGICLAALAASMLLPIIFALALQETVVLQAFLLTSVGLGFVSGGLIFALKGREAVSTRAQRLVLLAGVWAIVPLGGALPIYLSDPAITMTSAYFEAVSGFTTTGATIFGALNEVPRSILVWRSELQWLGGLTTYLTMVFLVGAIAGPEMMGPEIQTMAQRSRHTEPSIKRALKMILPFYATLTAVCLAALVLAGIPAFDSLCLAFSAVSTGGFMPRDGSISLYGSPAAELILTLFMFIGGVSLLWVKSLPQFRPKNLRLTSEPVAIGLAIILLGITIAAAIVYAANLSDVFSILRSVTLGLATAASYVTTTGFFISEQSHSLLPYILVVFLCVVGGGRFSTAGGLKFFRLADMFWQARKELNRLIYPHGVNLSHHVGEPLQEERMNSIRASFIVFIMFFWILALSLAFFEIPFQGAFLAAVSALSNIGPAYEFLGASSENTLPAYSEMLPGAKLLLCLGMIFGRVEILVLLGLFNFAYWRS